MGVLGLPSLYQLDILLRQEKAPILYHAGDSIFARVVGSFIEENKERFNLKGWHKVSFRLLRRIFLKILGNYEDSS